LGEGKRQRHLDVALKSCSNREFNQCSFESFEEETLYKTFLGGTYALLSTENFEATYAGIGLSYLPSDMQNHDRSFAAYHIELQSCWPGGLLVG
jgi:hypothetical protein